MQDMIIRLENGLLRCCNPDPQGSVASLDVNPTMTGTARKNFIAMIRALVVKRKIPGRFGQAILEAIE